MVLLKSNKTLFQLDTTLGDWLTLDGITLTEIQTSPMRPYTVGSCLLTDAKVALPSLVTYPVITSILVTDLRTSGLNTCRIVPAQLNPIQVMVVQVRTSDQMWRYLHTLYQ